MSDFLDSTDYHPRNIRYKRVKKKRALDTLVRVRWDALNTAIEVISSALSSLVVRTGCAGAVCPFRGRRRG